jgi:predicted nucleotidyltransferase
MPGVQGVSMPNSVLTQLLDQLRALLPDLQERYGVQSLGVFGSYVRGQQDPDSDLDLLVGFDDRPLSLFDFVRMENELSDELGLKVDLAERRALKPHIGQRILAEVIAV